jgi:hypothetical protein
MSASINITACDNELYVIASTPAFSSEICHITPGYNDPVAYAVNLGSILPGGKYSLTMIAVNWGGSAKFAITVTNNGTPTAYTFSNGSAPVGVVWTQTVPVEV